MFSRAALAAVALAATAPALAQDVTLPPPSPVPGPLYTPPPPDTAVPHADWNRVAWAPGQREAYERARIGWLRECRRRMALDFEHRDDGIGGALIGGVAGGLIGNRLGKRGDRAFGTIAGAAVGAVAGAAIDKAEDRHRAADESDYCQSYLDYYSYVGTYQQGAYAQPVMIVPVQHVAPRAPAQPECTEEVIYEDVDVPVNVPARRIIPRRPAPKRLPDKRVPL